MILRPRVWSAKDTPEEMRSRLNEAWRELVIAIGSLLPFSLRDVEFAGPAAALTFTVDTIKRPRGVLLVSLYETSTGATTAVSFAWTYSSSGVTTTSFAGLSTGTYKATFLVIGGG